jgi:stage III sporulation protein AC
MNVDLIFKIAAVGILVAVLNLLLSRSGRDEQALMTTIAGLVVVLVIIVREISELFNLIKSLFGFSRSRQLALRREMPERHLLDLFIRRKNERWIIDARIRSRIAASVID